tara:strand:+ start:268 stop:1005 length:738 start_codon:yes stop_codon:yes gene_type:complete
MTFSRIFKPRRNYLLKRIGKENDGGYLINPNAILKSDYLLSIGIFDDWSFEKNFNKYNKNAKIFCYDDIISFNFIFTRSIKKIILDLIKLKFKNIFKNLYTIVDYIFINNKIKFYKKKITTGDIHEIIKNLDKVFLKVDIEGSEYNILEDILKVQNKISALIIEFHNINKYRTVIENFIQRLELDLTHIHPNNYGKLDKNNDPIIIELSFEKHPKIIGGEVKLPNILDKKNNPKKNDIFIKFNDT